MKALTLHQPWASLVAIGYKTILTPAWSTEYRGPLAIHAAAKRPLNYEHRNINADIPGFYDHVGLPWEWWEYPEDPRHGGLYRWSGPLGALVATCELVDVVPIVAELPWDGTKVLHAENGHLMLCGPFDHCGPGWTDRNVTDQVSYGDFSEGRYAWLLDDIKPVDPPVPCRGRQGLWTLPSDAIEVLP